MAPTLFLPGAGGRRSFWQPVAGRLGPATQAVLIGWPGFGDEPARPDVRSLGDLVPFVLERVYGGFHIVAQSMGGVVALQAALAAPDRVLSLVLCATSGGIVFGGIQREDWRLEYEREMPPSTPRWFLDDRTDLTSRLNQVRAPALVLGGSNAPIVPEAAARRLASLLPDARLEVISGAGHDMAQTHADEVARHIAAFLRETADRAPRPAASRASGPGPTPRPRSRAIHRTVSDSARNGSLTLPATGGPHAP